MNGKILAYGVVLSLSGTAAQAHHSISGFYDSNRSATIEGVIAEVRFVNPHPFVMLEVKEDDGTTRQWQLEMDNRSELIAVGFKVDTLKPGERVVVTGSLARRLPLALYILKLERRADGFTYEQVGSSPRISVRRP